MQITITQKEYEAISFARSEIQSLIEAADDKEYLKSATDAESQLYSILDKFKKAKSKNNTLKIIKKEVKKQCPHISDNIAMKHARQILKEYKKGK